MAILRPEFTVEEVAWLLGLAKAAEQNAVMTDHGAERLMAARVVRRLKRAHDEGLILEDMEQAKLAKRRRNHPQARDLTRILTKEEADLLATRPKEI